MTRVDAHHHVWDPGHRPQPWLAASEHAPIRRSFTFEDLAPALDDAGIDVTVLVQTLPDPGETPELLELTVTRPRIGAVTGWVDLTARDLSDRITRLREGLGGQSLRGIRHPVQGEPDDDWLRRADVTVGLETVAAHGLVYELLTFTRHLPAALAAVDAVPGLQFVLDHASKPPLRSGDLATWAEAVSALASRPNVVCKLSGLTTEADWLSWTPAALEPVVTHLLDVFGPTRLMLGSDWPVCLLAGTYAQTSAAYETLVGGLSRSEQDQVLGLTATQVYGLTDATKAGGR